MGVRGGYPLKFQPLGSIKLEPLGIINLEPKGIIKLEPLGIIKLKPLGIIKLEPLEIIKLEPLGIINGYGLWGFGTPGRLWGVVPPIKYFLLLPAKYERISTKNEYSIPLG